MVYHGRLRPCQQLAVPSRRRLLPAQQMDIVFGLINESARDTPSTINPKSANRGILLYSPPNFVVMASSRQGSSPNGTIRPSFNLPHPPPPWGTCSCNSHPTDAVNIPSASETASLIFRGEYGWHSIPELTEGSSSATPSSIERSLGTPQVPSQFFLPLILFPPMRLVAAQR
ncbi:hypothetical protein DPEC_G00100580 [Dallia pectoralis]|uniref:Uncharacterized protein n=1 Tax=Dallia pectoralis TaxID=75939 RepID=A0ACC2GWZ3_DALPE|nr:hypothetical protein DPEC_G00100580 [Dallia pectoralis]